MTTTFSKRVCIPAVMTVAISLLSPPVVAHARRGADASAPETAPPAPAPVEAPPVEAPPVEAPAPPPVEAAPPPAPTEPAPAPPTTDPPPGAAEPAPAPADAAPAPPSEPAPTAPPAAEPAPPTTPAEPPPTAVEPAPAVASPVVPTATPTTPTEPPVAAATDAGRRERVGGGAAMAVGGVFALTGLGVIIGFSVQYNNIEHDLRAAQDDVQTRNCALMSSLSLSEECSGFLGDLEDLEEKADRANEGARAGGILMLAGAVAATAGAIAYYYGRQRRAKQTTARVRVEPTLGGATLRF